MAHYEQDDPHRRVASAKRIFFRDMLIELQQKFPEDRQLLDIGCGYGYFLQMAQKFGWRTWGVEITEGGAKASEKVTGAENVYRGSIGDAGYKNSSYDAITMWDVLRDVENPEADLKECFRILKNGGKIGIRVRNASFQKRLFQFYRPLKRSFQHIGISRP